MKRWMVNCLIGAYLSALAWGTFAHTFSYNPQCHPLMYYVVWDMYSMWTAYESRLHIIGEGKSGRFYELSPPPWGTLNPWSKDFDRATCDFTFNYAGKFANNTLRHTRHEPIVQVYAIEEVWAKQYNAPDDLWHRQFAEAKDFTSYFNVVKTISGNGETEQNFTSWRARLLGVSVWNNPRLMREAKELSPMFHLNGYIPSSDTSTRGKTAPGYQPLAH